MRQPRGVRPILGVIAALAALVAASLTASAAVSAPQGADRGLPDRLLAGPMRADKALSHLSRAEVAEVADRNRMSVRALRSNSTDRTLWLDATGHRFYVDDFRYSDRGAGESGRAPFPFPQTFTLHSLPGSQRTIYLDFTGHTVSGTAWNDLTGTDPQVYSPYDSNGNAGVFTNAEKTQIQLTFQRIAEDYQPFNVDVTTEQPPNAAIDRTNAADQVYGTRLLFTAGGDVYNIYCQQQCGGVAYVDVFDIVAPQHAYYQPGFVFTDGVGTGAKNMSEAGAHEVGHNLALDHDGTSTLGYYPGHGAWAPIMGVGYNHPISQWSRGEYADANNAENDLAIIKASGAPARADDHGNTTGAATVLGAGKNGVIATSTDKDVFRFSSTGGSYTMSVTPPAPGPNLDVVMRLLRANGTVLNTVNPASAQVSAETASGLNATLTRNLPSGTYYLQVSPTGFGNPANTGYSTYGSLGAYSVRAAP